MLKELITKGRRKYGGIYETKFGLVYLAYRRPKDVFLNAIGGERGTISQAIDSGKAEWAIDEELFHRLRAKGVQFFGFWIQKLNWIFLAPLELLCDPHCYKLRNYSTRGGALQRYVPLQHFSQRSLKQRL